MRTPRLTAIAILALGLATTHARAAEVFWTDDFNYTIGVQHLVSADWTFVSGNHSNTVSSTGTAGSPSGNNVADLPDSGTQSRVDRNIGTVVEGKSYRMTGFMYAENPGAGLDVALLTLMSGGSTATASVGLDDGDLKLICFGCGTSNLDGQDNGTWQWFELIYHSIAAASDQIEVRIDGAAGAVSGTPVGFVAVSTDLSTSVDNSLRLQGRDPAGFNALHFDDVSWSLFEPVTWTETFDYSAGVIQDVGANWKLVSGNIDSSVINNGTAGSVSGNNMLDLPDSGSQTRVDRDIGPVAEGSTYEMTGYIYAENPAAGLDVALIGVQKGSTTVAQLGLDDGALKLVVPGSPTLSLQGLDIGTWQRYEMLYHSIAAAADQIEVRVDGEPATVGGTPIGFVTVNTDLCTTNGNALRLQGRDPSAFNALHIDDVSWKVFSPHTWTETFSFATGVIQTANANWKLVSGNIDSEVIDTGTAGSVSGNNMLDLPDSGSQTRVDRDIGPVVEGSTYRLTGFIYAENPAAGLDVALMGLLSEGSTEITAIGLDDGAMKWIVNGSPTTAPQGLAIGTWQWYELVYRSIAAAADEMELRIDGLPATVGGTPIGVVSPNTDLSTTNGNSLRLQGRDPSAFNALHFDDVSWTLFEPVTWTEAFDYPTGVIKTVSANWKLVSGNLDSEVIDSGTAGSCSGNNMFDLPDSGSQTRMDRDIGPVVEGSRYRMTGFFYADNPGAGLDVALLALLTGATGNESLSLGLDDGALKLIRFGGGGTSILDGQNNGTWQWLELVYHAKAAAADEIEVRIDGEPASSGAPLGILTVSRDLSTTNGNTLRLQGRDPSAFNALHFDDVSWTLFEPVKWTDIFDYTPGVVHDVSAKWNLVAGNLDSSVIGFGAAGSPDGNNVLDLPDSGSQTREDRDIGPVIEGSNYWMTGYFFAENPGAGNDVVLMTLFSGATANESVSLGLDDAALKLIRYGGPTDSLSAQQNNGTWQRCEVIYHAIAGAADTIEVQIDGVASALGEVALSRDLSTTNGNTLRLQGRDVSAFSGLHFANVSWTCDALASVAILQLPGTLYLLK